MAVQRLVQNIGTGIAGTTVDFAFAFNPDAVFFRWTGRDGATDTGPVRTTARAGFGFVLNNGKRGCISYYNQDAVDPGSAGSAIWNTACIVRMASLSTTGGKADFAEMTSSGCTLVIDEAFAADMTVMAIAVSGVQFNTIEITEPGAEGIEQYTGAGFRPNFAMILGAGKTAFDTPSSAIQLMIGAAHGDGADANAVWAAFEEDAAGDLESSVYCRRTECVALTTKSAVVSSASRNAFVEDGLELDWRKRSGSNKYIAIVASGRFFVFPFTTATDTNPFSETGMTWSPEGLMVFSGCEGESTQDAITEERKESIGFATGPTARGVMLTRSTKQLTGASRSSMQHEFDEVYASVSGDPTPVQEGLMDINSAFASDEIEFVMDDADPSARFCFGIAIGPPAIESREQLIGLAHNSQESLKAGRPIFHDVFGRVLPVEQVEQDQWIFSGGALWPTPVKHKLLLEDPNTFYAEAVSISGDRLTIETDRESFFESLMRRLGRSG